MPTQTLLGEIDIPEPSQGRIPKSGVIWSLELIIVPKQSKGQHTESCGQALLEERPKLSR